MIYTDFTKAFDLVYHALLTKSLIITGSGTHYSRRYVHTSSIENNISRFTEFDPVLHSPSSDVLQVAILSPLLIVIPVNSTLLVLNRVKLLIFANKIFLHIDSVANCIMLQNGLNRLVK